jgi:uncharacterized cupredoxin-like copper-binding protein
MKTLILGAAGLALLGGCAALKSDYAALTTEQKSCAITESATFASSVPGWGHMTYAQKATTVSAGIDAVALACAIDSAALAQARPLISAAIQAAALVE